MQVKTLLIKNAAEVVTVSGFQARQGEAMSDLGIIANGAVYIEDGIITRVGASDEVEKSLPFLPDMVIDAKGKAVLPGFVDSHTHFVFGGYRADEFDMRVQGMDYMSIMEQGGGIINSVLGTRKASFEELYKAGVVRLNNMLGMGVTTVEGKSGYGLDLDTELKQLEVMAQLQKDHAMDIVPTFLGAHSIPPEYKGRGKEFLDWLLAEVLPVVKERGLAEFCDIFCEKNVFSVEESRAYLSLAKDMGMLLTVHADEIVQLGGTELAAALGAVSADHLLQASDKGIKALARTGTVATLLPITAFALREQYARGRAMIDAGCAVSLATDFNPGSCFSYSIPLLMALAILNMHLTTEEALCAVTLNGAAAVNRAESVGSLDVGKKGDVVILKYPSYKFIPYHVGINCVETVIKNGEVVVSRQ